jgi:hypothetical protein
MNCTARWRVALLALTASIVACAPSTFENLTGGDDGKTGGAAAVHELPSKGARTADANMEAPRPISPISVSWVNTLRPRFRWALRGGATSAVVELSRTRSFDAIAARLEGASEATAAENLAPGMWFWRVTGRTDATESPPGKVWQVLVRGPSKSGVASTAAHGSIVDVNGDGVPDLNFMALVAPDYVTNEDGKPHWEKPANVFITMMGQAETGTYLPFDDKTVWAPVSRPEAPFAGGSDVDGDGFADVALADSQEGQGGVLVFHGGKDGADEDKDDVQGWVATPWFSELPSLDMAGDINGDGYGDLSVLLPDGGYTALGSATGLGVSLMPFPIMGASASSKESWRAIAGCDLDGDGLSEIAIASSIPRSPITLTKSSQDRFLSVTTFTTEPDLTAPAKAIAITSGDFDGDGQEEFAFSTILDGSLAVCFHAAGPLKKERCWKDTRPAIEGSGKGIAAADLDGDGKDEILLAGPSGVSIITHVAEGFAVRQIDGPFHPSVAVLHPGRPDPARWAVATSDGKSIHVYSGVTVAQNIDITTGTKILAAGPTLR